ncbi:CynX/NimT family MFS transporter [Agromyces atrinae]|uniref:MFS transporter n=1 Tax=Agromyces atrinae TaxID=592376 RepID=A0A4Q2MAP4_9MICO|nr:MFS transporter [Agromyces atrinae]NYD65787.1 CP family cyanate transporter-like MFS transporter [Agromyces atrinae]RXZ86140.1 MFS transporter [Agromyces atrinae]
MSAAAPLWKGRALALVGILLVALNLRTAVASLSPIATTISADIPLPAVLLGALGMVPPLCFAVFGIATPAFTRRFGLERVLITALVVLTAGLVGRGLAPDAWWLLIASAATFAGIGVGNVVLPPLVKKYFPDRVGLLTTMYATILSLSTLVPPLIAVPVAEAAGWRTSLALWSVFALAALVPWIVLVVKPRRGVATVLPEEGEPALVARIWRSKIAWALTAIFFTSSFNAYSIFAWLPTMLEDIAGVTPAQAGILLSIYAGVGLPASLVVPIIAARYHRVGTLIVIGISCFVVGYAGLLFAPTTLPWLWVFFAGAGPLLFPLTLVLINLRTRTHEGAVALSGFVQSVGYLAAAIGPLLVGVIHETTGSWSGALVLLLASVALAAIAGPVAGRRRFLEDEPAR